MLTKKQTISILIIVAALVFIYIGFFKKSYKFLILWTGGGEREWAQRLEIACNNLGHSCRTVFAPQKLSVMEQSFLADCVQESAQDVADTFKLDIIIALSGRCQPVTGHGKTKGTLAGDNKRVFENPTEELLKFDGLLCACDCTQQLHEYANSAGKNLNAITWYPSCPASSYVPVTSRKLFYCGFQWDRKRNGSEYQKMFSLLDAAGYLKVYGPLERWECTPHSRKGYIPFDGTSMSTCMRQAGITLILHAQSHIELGAPTARIFEAASACTVIISDKNPFIIKEFGDSVLYIDGDLPAQQLYEQIDNHVQWILSHPQQAQELAQKAHTIFVEKFSLESYINNLITLHEQLTS